MQGNNIIGLVMATKIEAEPFITGFDLKKTSDPFFPVYKNDNIILIISGISKTCAAAATTYIITTFQILTLVNMGSAGAVKDGYFTGDIFQVDKIIEYDRPKIFGNGLVCHKPDYLKDLPSVTLSTQDRAIIAKPEREGVAQHADLVDMEAAAFIQTCRTFKAKGYVYKFISDGMDDNKMAILLNIKKFRGKLYEFFRNEVLPCL